jgi:hypothetical protein
VRLADRELARVLGGATLALMGVADDLAAHRQASEYPRVPEAPTPAWSSSLGRNSVTLLSVRFGTRARSEAEKALGEVREAGRRDHVTSCVREVLEAAHQGVFTR